MELADIVSIADRPGVCTVWLVGKEAPEGLIAFLYAISSITNSLTPSITNVGRTSMGPSGGRHH